MTVNPKALARRATADPIRPKVRTELGKFPSFISFHYKVSIECDQLSAVAVLPRATNFASEHHQQRNIKSCCLQFRYYNFTQGSSKKNYVLFSNYSTLTSSIEDLILDLL